VSEWDLQTDPLTALSQDRTLFLDSLAVAQYAPPVF
jgi:hypothetical protein